MNELNSSPVSPGYSKPLPIPPKVTAPKTEPKVTQLDPSQVNPVTPQPSPPTPPPKVAVVQKRELPSETNAVITKDLAVESRGEKYYFGTEQAKRIATIDLAIDQQDEQFAYWLYELDEMHLSEGNITRFMEALDENSVKMMQELGTLPEFLALAKNSQNKGTGEPPKFLDAQNKPNPEEQKKFDQIYYGMIHAAKMRANSNAYKSRELDYVKSGSTRASDEGPAGTPSALINARLQEYTGCDTQCEALRFGSLYDVNDPGNTVADLEAYLKNPGLLNQEISRRQKELKSLKSNILLRLNPTERQTKIAALEQSLKPLLDIKEGKDTEVTRKIEEKKRFVDDQMVQMIMVQVSQNLDHLQGDTFTFSYEGLLNELKSRSKHTIDSSGLIMDEGNNLKEMQAAFDRFYDKKLIFDKTGPFIDKEGNVHLPFPQLEHKVMVLEPIFFNLTVNGSTTNNPLQAELNKKGLAQLTRKIDMLLQDHPEIREQLQEIEQKIVQVKIALDNGASDFEVASDLLAAQFALRNLMKDNKLGCFAIGLGCFSAKDRTAIVMELGIIKSAVDPYLENQKTYSPEKQKRLRQKVVAQIVDPQGMSAEISFENTGTRVIKYMEVFLPGQEKTISTLAKSILYKMKQAKSVLDQPNLE